MEKGDKIARLRETISGPNYAVLSLLITRSPIAVREIYKLLDKFYTRKTLIIAVKELSLTLKVIEPQHVRYNGNYVIGYKIKPAVAEVIHRVDKLQDMLNEETTG